MIDDKPSSADGSAAAVLAGTAAPADWPSDTATTQPAEASLDITLKLYATLQDLLPAGTRRNAAPVTVRADASLNDVIDAYRVPRELAHLVLVNGVFVCQTDRDARNAFKAGDVLAIWPPVAGG